MSSVNVSTTITLITNNKEFRYYITTRFLVLFSLFIQVTVVSYYMYQLTGSTISLGFIGLAEVVPAIVCAFFAGYYVDKHEKRNSYLYCILLYVCNAIFLYIITTTIFKNTTSSKTVEWCIYVAMFFNGVLRAFLAPASFSLMPLLVSKETIKNALTWNSSSWMLGSIFGPIVAGFMLATIGISNCLFVAILCLLISIFFLLKISKKETILHTTQSMFTSLKEGFSFVFQTKIVIAILSLDLFAVLFGSPDSLIPVFSKNVLHISEVGYGWLRSAHGIGSLVFMGLVTIFPLHKKIAGKLFVSVFMYGVCIIVFAVSKNFYLSFFVLLLGGLFDAVSVIIRHSILQLNTPEEMKGRVSSINMMFISSSNELGAFESGMAASLLGLIPSVVFGGVVCLLVVSIIFIVVPSIRRIEL